MENRNEAVMLVAHNLDAIMTRRGLNAHQVANLVGRNPTLIYDILKGKARSPKLDTLDRIAKGLGIPLAALFIEPGTTDLDREVIEALGALPEADRRRFLLMAKSWRDSPDAP